MKTTKHTVHTLSDSEILHQSGDRPWMFSMLVDRYQKAFLRRSVKMLGSSESAEDVVADTFLKIYKNAHQFSERRGASFRSWAYKILMNTCYNELARRNKARVVEAYDFADLDVIGEGTSGRDFESDDRRSYVRSVLKIMPKSLSHFLELYFFEDKSQKEIALQENMSEIAVRSRIHRAKQSFKDVAKDLHVDTLLQTT
jgi:RNA polymerase sigma-70 factor (ECF subfamily)